MEVIVDNTAKHEGRPSGAAKIAVTILLSRRERRASFYEGAKNFSAHEAGAVLRFDKRAVFGVTQIQKAGCLSKNELRSCRQIRGNSIFGLEVQNHFVLLGFRERTD